MVDLAIDTTGGQRLERRETLRNVPASAGPEGALWRPFLNPGEYHDQALWSILDSEWRQAKAVWGPKVH